MLYRMWGVNVVTIPVFLHCYHQRHNHKGRVQYYDATLMGGQVGRCVMDALFYEMVGMNVWDMW